MERDQNVAGSVGSYRQRYFPIRFEKLETLGGSAIVRNSLGGFNFKGILLYQKRTIKREKAGGNLANIRNQQRGRNRKRSRKKNNRRANSCQHEDGAQRDWLNRRRIIINYGSVQYPQPHPKKKFEQEEGGNIGPEIHQHQPQGQNLQYEDNNHILRVSRQVLENGTVYKTADAAGCSSCCTMAVVYPWLLVRYACCSWWVVWLGLSISSLPTIRSTKYIHRERMVHWKNGTVVNKWYHQVTVMEGTVSVYSC